MDSGAINTLYREEMRRLLWFRGSMDATRNLSVFIVAGMAYVMFGLPETSSHLVAFIGSLTVFALLIFESRTCQFAENSEVRVREIEANYLAPAIDASAHPEEGWENRLAADLANMRPMMSFIEAFAARIYRNYFLIFIALDACWFSKLYLYPHPVASWSEFVHRADLGFVPGWLVLGVVVPVWGSYILLIIWLRGKYNGREPRY